MDAMAPSRMSAPRISFPPPHSASHSANDSGSRTAMLGKYSRDDGLFPLETAIYKMTRKPAEAMRIADRGVLAPGRKADIVVFDPDTVKDLATYENPRQYSVGIEHVFVNGIKVVEGDKLFEDAASGQVHRAGR